MSAPPPAGELFQRLAGAPAEYDRWAQCPTAPACASRAPLDQCARRSAPQGVRDEPVSILSLAAKRDEEVAWSGCPRVDGDGPELGRAAAGHEPSTGAL